MSLESCILASRSRSFTEDRVIFLLQMISAKSPNSLIQNKLDVGIRCIA